MTNKVSDILQLPIHKLKGIGEAKAETLQTELGVYRVIDLLEVFPYRYLDKTKFHNISSLRADNNHVQIKGTLISLQKVKGKNRRYRLQGLIKDSSGILELIWFQGASYMEKYLEVDQEYVVFGKVTKFGSSKNIVHPEMEKVDGHSTQHSVSHFEPIYPSTEKLEKKGLTIKYRRKVIKGLLSHLTEKDLPEILPDYMTERLKLCSRYAAYHWIHFPENEQQKQAAINRIKYQELFLMQLRLLYNKMELKRRLKGAPFTQVGKHFHKFYDEILPFELTGAQKRVLKEIRQDVGDGVQMNRLLQGDVGSGKTIVGFMSMLIAVDNGFQNCLMAPTEILAQQHYESIKSLAENMDVEIAFLSGSVKGKSRKIILERLEAGEIDIIIGTHALIEDPVIFKNLGLVVIDEQHRFGVEQRAKLWLKNKKVAPHILVMTATPIPRTLHMTSYGDLDISVIDELPPGRKDIVTRHLRESKRPDIIRFMRQEIEKGRQIYVVFPLIEESEKLDLENLNSGYEKLLQYFPPPEYQISVVHGKMKAADKDFEMQRFVKGETQIMVATTVIEVGVNVPNASVMIIENANRFGLSQLHQLRGRVGRGAEQSYCILVTDFKLSNEAKERLNIMVETNDGFIIANEDLKIRGAGDVQGTQQSGRIDLKVSNLVTDLPILNVARFYAKKIMERDPKLQHELHTMLNKYMKDSKQEKKIWGRIS